MHLLIHSFFHLCIHALTHSFIHHYRMKELSAQMERQHELLKLVVQKMEIRTEADEFDSSSMDFPSAVNIGRSRTLPSLSDANKTVLRHVGIAAHWTKYKKSDSSNNWSVYISTC